MTDKAGDLTHIDEDGRARMVDVSEKKQSVRRAVARGCIVMESATLDRIVAGDTPKGSVLQVAELAGVMGRPHPALPSTAGGQCHGTAGSGS